MQDKENLGELIIEITSEKIPIVQNKELLIGDSVQSVLDKYHNLSNIVFQSYISCQRILLIFESFPSQLSIVSKTIKGPKVESKNEAVRAFAAKYSTNVENLGEKTFKNDLFYCVEVSYEPELIQKKIGSFVEDIITSIKWPEYMRWSQNFPPWIRPIRRLVATYNAMPLVFKVGDIHSSSTSLYSFSQDEGFTFSSATNYFAILETRQIFIEHTKRYNFVMRQIKPLIGNLKLNEDSYKIINSIVEKSESPFIYLASCANDCILPQELIKENMIYHQSVVPLFGEDDQIANSFLVYSDHKLTDNGERLILQSGKSLSARLTEADYYWKKDLKVTSEDYLKRLSQSPLYPKLGSLAEQASRFEFIISKFPSYSEDLTIAARFLNFDLTMDTIYETPELHGIVSSLYASIRYEVNENIARIIRESREPCGEEVLPRNLSQAGATLGLVSRLDRLVGFFGIGEIPTGSSDPMGLRRSVFALLKLGPHIKDCPSLSELINHIIILYKEQGIVLKVNTKEILTDFITKRLGSSLQKLSNEFGHLFLNKEITWQEVGRLENFIPFSHILPNLQSTVRRLSGLKVIMEKVFNPAKEPIMLYSTHQEDEIIMRLLNLYPVVLAKEPNFMLELSLGVDSLLNKVQINSLEDAQKSNISNILAQAYKILTEYCNLSSN